MKNSITVVTEVLTIAESVPATVLSAQSRNTVVFYGFSELICPLATGVVRPCVLNGLKMM